MTKDEAIKELERISDECKGDPEAGHAEADDVLLEYLNWLGDASLVIAYKDCRDKIGFWYA